MCLFHNCEPSLYQTFTVYMQYTFSKHFLLLDHDVEPRFYQALKFTICIHFQFLFCIDCPDIEPSLYQTLEMSKPFVSSTPMKYEKSDASLLTTCTYTEVPCADFDPEAEGISLCIDKNGTAHWPARMLRIIFTKWGFIECIICMFCMHVHKKMSYTFK